MTHLTSTRDIKEVSQERKGDAGTGLVEIGESRWIRIKRDRGGYSGSGVGRGDGDGSRTEREHLSRRSYRWESSTEH